MSTTWTPIMQLAVIWLLVALVIVPAALYFGPWGLRARMIKIDELEHELWKSSRLMGKEQQMENEYREVAIAFERMEQKLPPAAVISLAELNSDHPCVGLARSQLEYLPSP